jgi:hypothetical protein
VSILVVGDNGGALNTPHIGGYTVKSTVKIEKWSIRAGGDSIVEAVDL